LDYKATVKKQCDQARNEGVQKGKSLVTEDCEKKLNVMRREIEEYEEEV
jgi:hypothetical protein